MIKKKWFLYCTEFFAGMSVMAVELAASRLLAPYFSSSQIIWTIIIGTIMIAMALGNVIGGRLADKKPKPDRLYWLLLIAAIWIALIPFLGKYLIGGISFLLALFINNNFLIWASFFCCMVIFVFPLLILGMVTPTLVKFCVNTLENNGKIVGELNALNTIGSILGTFLPTFVIIPKVGSSATFIIFAVILFSLAITYFISTKQKLIRGAIAGVVIIALGINVRFISFSLSREGIVYEGESMYNYLRVVEDDSSVILSTNVLFGVQSIKRKNSNLTGFYYDYSLAACYMSDLNTKESSDVLILGLGTGTFATQVLDYFPNANVEGVEIDEKIVSLAEEYFDLPEEVKVAVDDGRAYMRNAKMYDVIMVDAYQDITIPFHMSTKEFYEIIKAHLKPDGIIVVNMSMYSEKENSINTYLCDTIYSVFPEVYQFKVPSSTNCLLFVGNNTDMLSKLSTNYQATIDSTYYYMQRVEKEMVKVKKGNKILTDDKTPVELLGMSMLDEIINEQLEYYRGLFKGKSLRELFDLLK